MSGILTPLRSMVCFGLRPSLSRMCFHPRRMAHPVNNDKRFTYELPPLMDFDPSKTGLPLLTKLKVNFFLKPFIDSQFDPYAFLEGAQQAVAVISTHLANDKINEIKPFVSQQALEEIAANYSRFSPGQKLMLGVDKEDIQASYLYNVAIKRLGSKRYNVQMVVVMDVLNNSREAIQDMKLRLVGQQLSLYDFKRNLEIMRPLIDKKFVCIYRFNREYQPNDESSDWIVDKLIHFKNTDILRLTGYIK